jgi:hypothetical protein
MSNDAFEREEVKSVYNSKATERKKIVIGAGIL